MSETLAATTDVCTIYEVNNRLFNTVLDTVAEADADKQMNDNCNCIRWNAGHLINSRFWTAQMIGIQVEDPYNGLFKHGEKYDANADYPTLEEMKQVWNDLGDRFIEELKQVSSDKLAEEPPMKFPISDQTLGGLVAFLAQHESYHIGQMGINRKFLGYEAMGY